MLEFLFVALEPSLTGKGSGSKQMVRQLGDRQMVGER